MLASNFKDFSAVAIHGVTNKFNHVAYGYTLSLRHILPTLMLILAVIFVHVDVVDGGAIAAATTAVMDIDFFFCYRLYPSTHFIVSVVIIICISTTFCSVIINFVKNILSFFLLLSP